MAVKKVKSFRFSSWAEIKLMVNVINCCICKDILVSSVCYCLILFKNLLYRIT